MFKRVLIANRGEIAVRIAKTLQQMGLQVAMIYSEADQNSIHLHFAEQAYLLTGSSLKETYLNIEKIVEVAKQHNIDAIHPGYGFLSENPKFAEACSRSKLIFIGPTSKVIRTLGDKLEAKRIARELGIPTLPSVSITSSDNKKTMENKARNVGYPILIKAVAGGGGKGVRIVSNETDLFSFIEASRREAKNAFNDERIFLEKYIEHPRHIEVQILGDHQGNVIHLFDRECSIQRRYQKVIEETPSVLSNQLSKMLLDAVKIGKAIHYTNAGTVEFLVDHSGNYYFLEMNTRLQVEHAVTEMTTMQDLVRLQVEIAQGKSIASLSKKLSQTGHSIECRIYAEDPQHQFLPSIGTITTYAPPEGPNIRVDSGVAEGSAISINFDPMLAKLVVWGESREEARERMAWALRYFVILGITTNLEFLQNVIGHREFKKGNLHTHFIEEHYESLSFPRKRESKQVIFAHQALPDGDTSGSVPRSPWKQLGNWGRRASSGLPSRVNPKATLETEGTGEIISPMPGRIVKTNVKKGEKVKANQPMIVLESMKMEITLSASISGRITQLLCKAGDLVDMGQLLARVEK